MTGRGEERGGEGENCQVKGGVEKREDSQVEDCIESISFLHQLT